MAVLWGRRKKNSHGFALVLRTLSQAPSQQGCQQRKPPSPEPPKREGTPDHSPPALHAHHPCREQSGPDTNQQERWESSSGKHLEDHNQLGMILTLLKAPPEFIFNSNKTLVETSLFREALYNSSSFPIVIFWVLLSEKESPSRL